MVSILTLTYKRKELLEEAIYSYLNQINGYEDNTEMVIINDDEDTNYIYNHPNIRIINTEERFPSIGKKLEWGFKQCKYGWVYRLDDDDLLSPYALKEMSKRISENPNKDIITDSGHYHFVNNEYKGINGSVNNGNCYNINYINNIGPFINKSFGEDHWLTYENNADMEKYDNGRHTMIYRWGMNVYHVSALGDVTNEEVYERIKKYTDTQIGDIQLNPHFNNNYWGML